MTDPSAPSLELADREKLADRFSSLPRATIGLTDPGPDGFRDDVLGYSIDLDDAERDLIVSALRQPAGVSQEIVQRISDIISRSHGCAGRCSGECMCRKDALEILAALNRPQESEQPGEVERLRAALALGREAVVESFNHAKSLDDTYLAEARLRDIDAALAPRQREPLGGQE